MPTARLHPIWLVIQSWVFALLFASWAAVGPVHRNDLLPYWNRDFFLTIIKGPLSDFIAQQPSSSADRIGTVFFTICLLAAMVWHLRQPSIASALTYTFLMLLWLLIGLGITYAWV